MGLVASVMVHNFTPYFSTLQFLPLPSDGIEFAHHFDNVAVGDRILWGATVEEALTYEVAGVRTVLGLADLYFARCVRAWPTVYVAGSVYAIVRR